MGLPRYKTLEPLNPTSRGSIVCPKRMWYGNNNTDKFGTRLRTNVNESKWWQSSTVYRGRHTCVVQPTLKIYIVVVGPSIPVVFQPLPARQIENTQT